MSLTFESPIWLALIALVIPVAITGALWFRASMSRARMLSAIALRSAVVALIAAMLAGASSVRTSERQAVIAVIDVSESVRAFGGNVEGGAARALAMVERWLDYALASPDRTPDDLFGAVVFDGASIAAMTPRTLSADPGPDGPFGAEIDFTMVEGSNIDQALRFASALFPPDATRRLVLFSDGNETQGDALAAAEEISAQGPRMPIDVVPLAYNVTGEVLVEDVDAPPQAAEGSTVRVRVVLRATQRTAGTLQLLYEGEPVDINGDEAGFGRRVVVESPRSIFDIELELGEATVHRLRPVFTPTDPALDRVAVNNAADAFTITPGKGRVLVVDGVDDARPGSPGRTLVGALESAGVATETIAPSEMPVDLLRLQANDLVIMQNVAADEISLRSQRMLIDYVTELGGGLVMSGGPDAFGAGAWNGTEVEDILPVELDLPEQLIVPPAAIVIVLDNSGSMNFSIQGSLRVKQEVANEGAALAIETLDPRDLVCVLAFNTTTDTVVPMQRNSDPEAIARRVRSIRAGGGTNLGPALIRALRQLQAGDAARASVRHVIVLSDGRSEGSPESFIETARRMNEEGISVSTIAVGDEADSDTMRAIAEAGAGEYYPVSDPNTLPRVFIRDIRIVRKPLIRQVPFVPMDLDSASPVALGLGSPLARLEGLVLTQPKEDPLINYAIASPEGEPILAHWFVGRGQVAAWTSDAHNWAQPWITSGQYAQMWTQMVRTIARPTAGRSSDLSTRLEGDDLVVRLDATDDDGAPIDLLSVPGALFTPAGERVDIALEQIGPGAYETRVPARARGNYVVALFPRRGDNALPSVVGAASRALGEEYRRLRSNVGLLQQIAQATGGTVHSLDDPTGVTLYDKSAIEPVRASSPMWRVLLVWTLALMLLDVATRRVAWDRLLTRELADEIRAQALERVKSRSESAARTTTTLRKTSAKDPERQTSAEPRPSAPLRRVVPKQAPKTRDKAPDTEASAEMRKRMLERLGKGSGGQAPGSKPESAPVRKKAGKTRRSSETPAGTGEGEGGEGRSTTSGLLDAKRRAREKLEGEQGSQDRDA